MFLQSGRQKKNVCCIYKKINDSEELRSRVMVKNVDWAEKKKKGEPSITGLIIVGRGQTFREHQTSKDAT
jgi:hypothetical protein